MIKLIDTLKVHSPRWYAALETNTARAFWLFAFAQLVLWTLLPALFFTNLPLDVIELLSWGHEWQLGYSKHPPLPAWILEAFAYLSGRSDWTAYFASQLSIMLAYWAIWQLGRETAGSMGGLLAVLLTSLIFYYHLPTIEFNHNVLQMPVWALLGLYGWRVLTGDRLLDWLWLGVVTGLSLYVKYSMAIMVLALIVFFVATKQGRQKIMTRGFLVALLAAILVASPHVYWMVSTDFQSLFYADGRMKPLVGVVGHILGPLKFLLAQIGSLGAALLVILLGGAILPMDRARGVEPISFQNDDQLARRYILWIALAPLLFTAVLSLLLGVKFRTMWGAPMLSFSVLALMIFMKPFLFKERFGFMVASWAVLHVGLLSSLIAMGSIGSFYAKKPLRTDYPGRQVGAYFSKLWQEKTGLSLRYVDGREWIGGNVAYYGPERPSEVSLHDHKVKPWIKLHDVACKGVLILWKYSRDELVQMPEDYGPTVSLYAKTGQQEFAWKMADDPVSIGWAMTMPDGKCK